MMSNRWKAAAAKANPELAKKNPAFSNLLNVVKAVHSHAKQKLFMEKHEREFHGRVMKGPEGASLAEEQDAFCNGIVEEFLGAEHEDKAKTISAVKQLAKNLQEAAVLHCLPVYTEDQRLLKDFQRKKADLERLLVESQRNYMADNTSLNRTIKDLEGDLIDEDEASQRILSVCFYDGLASLDEELRMACEEVVTKQARAKLLNPGNPLLRIIQKLLKEGEGAISDPKSGGPPSPGSPGGKVDRQKAEEEKVHARDKKRIEDQAAQIEEIEAQLAKRQEEIAQAKSRVAGLKRKRDQQKTDQDKEIEELRTKIANAAVEAENEIAQLQAEEARLKEKTAKDLEEARRKLAELTAEAEKASKEEKAARAELDKAERERDRLLREIKSAEERLAAKNSEMSSLASEITALKVKNAKDAEQLKALGHRMSLFGSRSPSKEAPSRSSSKERGSKERPSDANVFKARSGSKSGPPGKLGKRKFVKNSLLEVLRQQLLLSTPPGGKRREWGSPLDKQARMGPTGDANELAKVVALLLEEVDLDSSDDEDQSSNGIPCSSQGVRRRGTTVSLHEPQSPKLNFFLAPPPAPSSMRPSRSCTDIRSAQGSDTRTIRPDFTKTLGRPDFTKTLAPLGSSCGSICGHCLGVDHCPECQTTVPRLSVGWCLPPLERASGGDLAKTV